MMGSMLFDQHSDLFFFYGTKEKLKKEKKRKI